MKETAKEEAGESKATEAREERAEKLKAKPVPKRLRRGAGRRSKR